MTFSRWHSYELLMYILSIVGSSNIIITTFGLSEEAIRALQKLKNNGYIKHITVIINLSARTYKKKLLVYLNNIADEILLQNIHAKIFLIQNDKLNVVVNQSANFSTNPTNEAGYLSTKEKDIKDFCSFLEQTKKISIKYGRTN